MHIRSRVRTASAAHVTSNIVDCTAVMRLHPNERCKQTDTCLSLTAMPVNNDCRDLAAASPNRSMISPGVDHAQ